MINADFQLHDVFNFDFENRDEDMPRLIDQKVTYLYQLKYFVLSCPIYACILFLLTARRNMHYTSSQNLRHYSCLRCLRWLDTDSFVEYSGQWIHSVQFQVKVSNTAVGHKVFPPSQAHSHSRWWVSTNSKCLITIGRLISDLVVVIVSSTCGVIAFACAGQPVRLLLIC